MEERGWRLVEGEGDIPPNRAYYAEFFFFFFFQRVCMNGLLITHQADIILISPALIYIFFCSTGISALESEGEIWLTSFYAGLLHNERAVNYIPR